ncbi:MAG: cytochrome [Gammaproteobacteria bacterium]|nr:cytochrome [Gammaproteobacteria bacterium]
MSSRCPEIGICLLIALSLTACEREDRRFSEAAAAAKAPDTITQSDLQPGGPTPRATLASPYDDNAYAVSQGKQLFEWFNCSGCHAQGGGAIGPALMDEKWIYGAAPENIFASIVEGRPNGMPSFRGRIPTQQVWQLVGYVRSLSGQVRKDVASSRSDHLFMKKSEQSLPQAPPAPSSPPPQGQ